MFEIFSLKFWKIEGKFDCSYQDLEDFKGVRFGIVDGYFNCSGNKLKNLYGAPKKVTGRIEKDGSKTRGYGDFFCSSNQLTSLNGAPKTVGGSFWCEDNPVSETTLENIFALMEKRKSYQQALEEHWPDMGDEDRVLMYKQIPNLPPEEVRKYKALATYNSIKNYL